MASRRVKSSLNATKGNCSQISHRHTIWLRKTILDREATGVNEYSQRDLTSGKDKLIAIAGLASYLHGWLRSHDESSTYNYIAGLWEPELPAGLLWYVYMVRWERRPKPNRAPPWSWASVRGAVFNDSTDLSNATCGVNISAVSIKAPVKAARDDTITAATRPDTHPLGDVSEGSFITVRGQLQEGFWSREKDPTQQKYYIARSTVRRRRQEFDFFDYNHAFSPMSSDSHAGPLAHILQSQKREKIGRFLPDTHEEVPQKLFCLKVAVEPGNAVDKDNPTKLWVVRGLALTPTDDTSTAFRRVGYFELDHRELGLYWDTIRETHGGDVSKRLWPNVDPFGFSNFEYPVREVFLTW